MSQPGAAEEASGSATALSRRSLLRGAGIGALLLTGAPAILDACAQQSRSLSAVIAAPPTRSYIDFSVADHLKVAGTLQQQHWLPISLSMYGDPADPRFAAVYAPDAASWGGVYNVTFAAAASALAAWAARGYYPTILSALGTGAAARVSLIFVQANGYPPVVRWDLTWGQNDPTPNIQRPASFIDYTEFARSQRIPLLLSWVTVYGSPSDRRYAGIWSANAQHTRWTAGTEADSGAEDGTAFGQRLAAQQGQGARPTLIARSGDLRFLGIFRDDPIQPPPLVRADVSRDDYLQDAAQLAATGWYPQSVQAAGSGAGTRYSAIFVQGKQPSAALRRKWQPPIGWPTTAVPIDDQVRAVMERYGVRAASLAIVHDRKLVLARAYTYAEDGYPATQPTTQFRIASCSKLITALAIWRMLHPPGGPPVLALDDTLQGILALNPPPGHSLAAGFEQITVRDLLEMRSGLLYEVAGRTIMEQAAQQLRAPLPLSAAQGAAYLAAYPLSDPPYGYNNSGYAMLGNILARKLAPGTPDLARGYLQAIMASVMTPLHCSNVGLAGTLESDLAPTEARYDSSLPADYTDPNTGAVLYHKVQDLCLLPSVMHDDGRLVPAQYGGWYNHALLAGGAGLRIAMPDLARVLAALNVTGDNPLFDASTLPDLFASAQAANSLDYWNLHGCYGWDAVRATGDGAWYAMKGGYVFGAQSVVHFTSGGLCFAMAWNFDNVLGDWSPDFPEVLALASGANVSATDLFPTYDAHMSSL